MSVSAFGRVRLGYVLVESLRKDEWIRFASEGLGMHVDEHAGGVLGLRVDERPRRMIIVPGASEDVRSLGWEVDDDETLRVLLARLRERGVAMTHHTGALAQLRGVDGFWSGLGPKRTQIELFRASRTTTEPLCMKTSAFLCGAGGLGHVAITTREPQAMESFWTGVFDARISDRISDRLSGVDMAFTFLRLNERHHSVAIASTQGVRLNPMRTAIHHLNLQAASLDDVVEGYRRCRALGYPIANAIGQHPNDKELSFYVQTPSDFEMELGWNPLVVDAEAEASWQPASYQGISLWGHFPENATVGLTLRRFGAGVKSLMRQEYKVG